MSDNTEVREEYAASIPGFAVTWALAYCAGADQNDAGYPHRVSKHTIAPDGTITEEPINAD